MESPYWPPTLPDTSTIAKLLDRLPYRAQQWSVRAPHATLPHLLAETGFAVEAVEPHHVAKVFVARKPWEGACS